MILLPIPVPPVFPIKEAIIVGMDIREDAKITGITPADALYIGDSGVDMQTARRSGITSIGVSWGFRPRQELTENGACHIVDRPEEIIRYL